MEKQSKTFANGFIFKRNDNAPDFVVGKLSIKAQDAIMFINQHNKKGWLNLDIKKSKEGKFYMELDTYEVKESNESNPEVKKRVVKKEDKITISEDLPF
jgi:hypothetical protein